MEPLTVTYLHIMCVSCCVTGLNYILSLWSVMQHWSHSVYQTATNEARGPPMRGYIRATHSVSDCTLLQSTALHQPTSTTRHPIASTMGACDDSLLPRHAPDRCMSFAPTWSDSRRMLLQLTKCYDEIEGTMENWDPHSLSAKSNSADTPNWNEAMNGPNAQGF